MSDTKTPAFRFYPADFVMGTATMDSSAIGSYMLLLCHQWDTGCVPGSPKDAARIAKTTTAKVNPILESKFPIGDDGLRRNARLERERAKAEAIASARKEHGTNGAKKRWQTDSKSHGKTIAEPSANDSKPIAVGVGVGVSVQKHEREPDFPEVATRPSEREVLSWASINGLAEWKAKDWFNEMQGCGWLDFHSRPIVNWVAVATRVKVKWEADGRPMSPPTKTHRTGIASGMTGADKILRSDELKRVELAIQKIDQGYSGMMTWSEKDLKESKRLKELRRELKNELGIRI